MKYFIILFALVALGCSQDQSDNQLQLIISTESVWQAVAYPSLAVYNGVGPAHIEIDPSDSVAVAMVKGDTWRLMAYTSFPCSETKYSTKPYGSVMVYPR